MRVDIILIYNNLLAIDKYKAKINSKASICLSKARKHKKGNQLAPRRK